MAENNYSILPACGDDLPRMRELFRQTVRTVNRRDYTVAEVADWASCADDEVRWRCWMAEYHVFVAADCRGGLLGYVAISDAGVLHSLFVHSDYQGQGIATCLLERAEATAFAAGVGRIVSEVSLTARPFFERRGYRTVERQQRKARCLLLTNFRMEKIR